MPRVTSIAIALGIAVAACGQHEDSRSSSSAAADTRCGTSTLTGATWVGDAGWVGAGLGAVGVGYYGVWYDPGDTYDPVTDNGGLSGGTDDGYYTDPSGDPSDEPVSDVPGGDDDSSPSSDDTGDDGASTDSLEPLSGAVNGCFTCTVGCTSTDANGQREGQQAMGVSDVSYDDACRSGVASLGAWSHTTLHRPLDTCQQFDPSFAAGTSDAGAAPNAPDAGDSRVPAKPTVGPR